jgi:4,5-DOPA dioxygenase extradiol
MFPTLFVSHGSPQIAIMNHETNHFLTTLPNAFDTPKYIISLSAHWVTKDLRILAHPNPGIIYDFYGFPEALYEKRYPLKNDPNSVDKLVTHLNGKGLLVSKDEQRNGYDHGVWVPLSLMYKEAKIPVVQLSLPLNFTIEQLMQLGEALQNFKDEALILTSGNMTHNLRALNFDVNAPVENYAKEFRDWVVEKLEKGDEMALKNFLNEAPFVHENHPTLEHFLPLFIALGASKSKIGTALNSLYIYGNQAMDTIVFNE